MLRQNRGMKKTILILAAISLTFFGCSEKFSEVIVPRDAEFFQNFVNPSSAANQMPAKIPEMNLLETGKDYPMRFVLFDNSTFYYQVDKLGDGYGQWKYQDGALDLLASRPLFDMSISLTATEAVGDAMVVRFLDRRGFQSVKIQFLNQKTQKLSLPVYTKSLKDI